MTIVRRLLAGWKAFRAHYWRALGFDIVLIMAVFWAIHAWNTRDLPRDRPAPDLPAARLDATPGTDFVSMPSGAAGVVYFFAPWCFYCRNSIDNLDNLVRNGEIAWARAVALEYQSLDEVRAFVAETEWRQPVLLGSAQTARDWGVRAFPTYFLIDGEGQVGSSSVGYSTTIGLRARHWLTDTR